MAIMSLQLFLIAFVFGANTASSSIPIPLSNSIYLPKFNLVGELEETGAQIFKPLPPQCFITKPSYRTTKQFTFYKNTETFYTALSTTSSLGVSLKADYSLGFTLDVSTKSISGSKRTVTGNSLNIMASSKMILVNKTCLNNAAFSGEFLSDLSQLPSKISSPWDITSWRLYDTFLKKYGTHIVSAVTIGSSINQMAFADTSESYSEKDFQVKSCVSLAGTTEVGVLNTSICSNVTKEEISEVSSMTMSDFLTINGGTPETRNKLMNNRSGALIEQFMNEANVSNSPIGYTLTPIWERIQENFIGISDNYLKGINMGYYYLGYLNYGCPYKHEAGQDLQKFDYVEGSTPEEPQYECTLAPQGCHSDNDCHYKPIWCSCRGSSCVIYKDDQLDTDVIKKTAYMNTGSDWGWHGCDWKVAGFKCHCGAPSSTRLLVWSNDAKSNAAYNAHYSLMGKKKSAKNNEQSVEDKEEL